MHRLANTETGSGSCGIFQIQKTLHSEIPILNPFLKLLGGSRDIVKLRHTAGTLFN